MKNKPKNRIRDWKDLLLLIFLIVLLIFLILGALFFAKELFL